MLAAPGEVGHGLDCLHRLQHGVAVGEVELKALAFGMVNRDNVGQPEVMACGGQFLAHSFAQSACGAGDPDFHPDYCLERGIR
jgi:hypothetical protein